MQKLKVLKGVALTALLALSLIASAGTVAGLSARGHTEGVTWENGTVARGGHLQGVTWESGVTWD